MVDGGHNGTESAANSDRWPDGLTVKWKRCPACGCETTFFLAATEGEGALHPPGSTRLFTLNMRYATMLQQKEIVAFMDICPKCGTLFCRAILKHPVGQQIRPAGRPA